MVVGWWNLNLQMFDCVSRSRGSMVSPRLNCCTHTCFPMVGLCFAGGLGGPMFDESLACMSINEVREYISFRK